MFSGINLSLTKPGWFGKMIEGRIDFSRLKMSSEINLYCVLRHTIGLNSLIVFAPGHLGRRTKDMSSKDVGIKLVLKKSRVEDMNSSPSTL